MKAKSSLEWWIAMYPETDTIYRSMEDALFMAKKLEPYRGKVIRIAKVKEVKGGVIMAAKKNWIAKAVNPAHKGYCSPMSKSTCTPRRKALAKRFKKGI